MKKIFRYLWRDALDLGVLLGSVTGSIMFFINDIPEGGVILGVLGLYIFRSIMWMGQTVDLYQETLQKLIDQELINQEMLLDGTK